MTAAIAVRAPLAPCLAVGAAVLVAGLALVGVGGLGWVTGLACGAVLAWQVHRGVVLAGRRVLLPADLITLFRANLACIVAALAAEVLAGEPRSLLLAAIAAVALALDSVDGRVARRTATATRFGGRFDGEADAFLILVLSVAAAPWAGWWVLSAGLVRYVFGAVGWLVPWLRADLPFRYWRKVVTAVTGIALTLTASGLGPRPVAVGSALVAVALLVESFGRDVVWLWRHRCGPRRDDGPRSGPDEPTASIRTDGLAGSARADDPARTDDPARSDGRDRIDGLAGPARTDDLVGPDRADGPDITTGSDHDRGSRRWAMRLAVAALLALVWGGLLIPVLPGEVVAPAPLRLPGEAIATVAILLLLPAAARRVAAPLLGLLIGIVLLVKVVDIAVYAVLDRPLDLITAGSTIRSALSFVYDSSGAGAVAGAVAGALALAGVALVGVPWALARGARAATAHRRGALAAVSLAGAAWGIAFALGLQAGDAPIAAAESGPYAASRVNDTITAISDFVAFGRALEDDTFGAPGAADLAHLRDLDVFVVFVESYGRVALEGEGSDTIRAVLDAHGARLADAGFTARSTYLTSPTFGGYSWFAHSTLQSGLLIDSQSRYNRLLKSSRTTLISAFAEAGWRTVALLPATRGDWPEGRAFYGFDAVYGRSGLGYAGPSFGFSEMPDQFALAAFERLELDRPGRPPMMAEIGLTSSHAPWAPLPQTVAPSAVGDGSVFTDIHARASTPAQVWSDFADIRAAYRTSIAYSLENLLSFIERRDDRGLVVVLLGDHQPPRVVSGAGGDHDVPVSILASDPAVIRAIEEWGWTPGLIPDAATTAEPMASFRDRFFTAFSTPAPPARGTAP